MFQQLFDLNMINVGSIQWLRNAGGRSPAKHDLADGLWQHGPTLRFSDFHHGLLAITAELLGAESRGREPDIEV